MWRWRGMGARDGTWCGPRPTEGAGAAVGVGVAAGHQHPMAQCCLSALWWGCGCAVHQGCAIPYSCAMPYARATPMVMSCPMSMPSSWLCCVLWLSPELTHM